MGGYARRMGVISKIRSEEKNVLLFDAGDYSQGTPYFNFYNGRIEVDAMNRMKYDAITIGNHEFDNGVDTLAKVLRDAQFPVRARQDTGRLYAAGGSRFYCSRRSSRACGRTEYGRRATAGAQDSAQQPAENPPRRRHRRTPARWGMTYNAARNSYISGLGPNPSR